MDNLPEVITSLATLAGVLGSIWMSWRNSRKLETVDKKVDVAVAATNGMKTELVEEVRAAATALGEKQGRAAEKAEQKEVNQ